MEVLRNINPKEKFLHKVGELASERNVFLVFDECTSGFWQSFGGLHKIYGVEPDMTVFGEALGNAYGITAVIDRREVMDAAQSAFISSTFGRSVLDQPQLSKRLKLWRKKNLGK
jgi:glutamate-1-semialdehyde 2,1-aminomutase